MNNLMQNVMSPITVPSVGPADEAVFYDWSLYDGSENGTLQADYLSGDEWNTGDYSQVSAYRSLHVYTWEDSSESNRYTALGHVDIDPDTLELTLTEIRTLLDTGANTILPRIVKMANNRHLILATWVQTSTTYLYLVNDAGDIVDSASFGSSDLLSFNNIARITDTKAVVPHRGRADGDCWAFVVDIASDTITYGSSVEFVDGVTSGTPAAARLTDSTVALATASRVYHASISGTTLTITGASEHKWDNSAGSIKASGNETAAVPIAENVVLLTALDSSNSPISGVVTWGGSSFTHIENDLDSGVAYGNWIGDNLCEVQPFISGTQDGLYLYVAHENLDSTQGNSFLLTYNGSTLTDSGPILIADNLNDVEHPIVHQTVSGLVIFHYQDTTLWDWMVLSPGAS